MSCDSRRHPDAFSFPKRHPDAFSYLAVVHGANVKTFHCSERDKIMASEPLGGAIMSLAKVVHQYHFLHEGHISPTSRLENIHLLR